MNSNHRIACWMSEKKLHKFNWTEFENICSANGIEAFKLDLENDLASQGPFSILLHKLTDIVTLVQQGDQNSITKMKNIEEYLSRNPSIVVIDPLENVDRLLDRYKCYSIIHRINPSTFNVFTPSFCEITSNDPTIMKEQLQQAKVHYPFICKPIVGHGMLAHDMSIVFNERSFKDCKPPCVAQSFINHDGLLYKIFIVGDTIHVCERPSLKNFHAEDQDTIHFDSTLISKVGGRNSLTILDPEDQQRVRIRPDMKILETIASSLRAAFGLDLFGVDIVIENTTGKYAVVDVNCFPGYDGFPDFFPVLIEFLKSKLQCHSRLALKNTKAQTQETMEPKCAD